MRERQDTIRPFQSWLSGLLRRDPQPAPLAGGSPEAANAAYWEHLRAGNPRAALHACVDTLEALHLLYVGQRMHLRSPSSLDSALLDSCGRAFADAHYKARLPVGEEARHAIALLEEIIDDSEQAGVADTALVGYRLLVNELDSYSPRP